MRWRFDQGGNVYRTLDVLSGTREFLDEHIALERINALEGLNPAAIGELVAAVNAYIDQADPDFTDTSPLANALRALTQI